jgi:hypothetical protein
MKGVEEESSQLLKLTPSPSEILEMYRLKVSEDNAPVVFDDLRFEWNVDGTLSRMIALKNGEVVYTLDFVWNSNGTLNQIIRS